MPSNCFSLPSSGYSQRCCFLSFFFYNEPELGVGIDPGMALTPIPSSIGQGSNPRPSYRELSALLLDHSIHLRKKDVVFDSFNFFLRNCMNIPNDYECRKYK